MSKLLFFSGSISSGTNVLALAQSHGLFAHFWIGAFTVVFAFGVAVCGGLTALLIQDIINEKWISKKLGQS